VLLALSFVTVGCGQSARDGNTPAAGVASKRNPYREQIEDDIKVASEAVEKNPDSADALADRGRALMRGARLPEALDDLNKAIKLRPTFGVAYARRAECLLWRGDAEQARKDCEEAIRLDPKSAEGYLARALVNLRDNDQTAALDCNNAVLLSPLVARAYLLRGILQQKTNRDLAMADFNELCDWASCPHGPTIIAVCCSLCDTKLIKQSRIGERPCHSIRSLGTPISSWELLLNRQEIKRPRFPRWQLGSRAATLGKDWKNKVWNCFQPPTFLAPFHS
jgi:tetratricopeptide (TPR) repeat protein